MTTQPRTGQKHLASSPFPPPPEPVIETFAIDDVVSHDVYGVGRVISVEAHAVTVDFGRQTLRIKSPFHKLERL
jgi:hypothetical protein